MAILEDSKRLMFDYHYTSQRRTLPQGKYKDECGSQELSEFGGLRSTMNNFKLGSEKTRKTKGVRNMSLRSTSLTKITTCVGHKNTNQGEAKKYYPQNTHTNHKGFLILL